MIEDACGPGGDGMARRALRRSRRETGGNVVWHRAANRRGFQVDR